MQADAPADDLNQLQRCFATGDFVELEQRARDLVSRFPACGQAWLALGAGRLAQHKPALDELKRAAELLPDDPHTHNNLGLAYRGEGQTSRSIQSFERAIGLRHDFHQAQSNLAAVLMEAGRPHEAEAVLQSVLDLRPDLPDANNNMGILLVAAGRQEEAERCFRRALLAQPDNLDAQSNLARLLFSSGLPREAEAICRQALKATPPNSALLDLQGRCLFALGRPGEAEPSYRMALDLQPQSADTFRNLGDCMMAVGRYRDAELSYTRTLELKPGSSETCRRLAGSLRMQGRKDEARACYEESLRIDPDLTDACRDLGMLLCEYGEFSEALELMRSGIAAALNRLAAGSNQRSAPSSRTVAQPFDTDAAFQTLALLADCLQASEIPWCLFAGTALGIHREARLLPHDKDLDIAMPWGVERARVIATLAAAGFHVHRRSGIDHEAGDTHSLCFVHPGHRVGLDVFFLLPEGDRFYLVGVEHPAQPMLARVHRFDIDEIHWRGRSWPAPSPIETYLADVYGPDWRSPDDAFDTVISNPNRITAAIPLVLCYGYARLISSLTHRDWKKSGALCRQLLKRSDDPLLTTVLGLVQQGLARDD